MRVIGLLMGIGLVFLMATVSAATMSVSIDSMTVGAGTSILIPVKVTGATNLGAMDVTITYDPSVLQFSTADLGEISTNGMIEANSTTPGP